MAEAACDARLLGAISPWGRRKERRGEAGYKYSFDAASAAYTWVWVCVSCVYSQGRYE